MSNKILIRAGSSCQRRQPLLQRSNSGRKTRTRLGEAVGGTAAVCCCCPAVVANFMILAIYKVPVTLCRRALEKKKKHMLNKRHRNLTTGGAKEGIKISKQCKDTCRCYDDICVRICPDDVKSSDILLDQEEENDDEVMELMEKEMWARFSTTGFWRSPSQADYSNASPQLIIDSASSTVSVPS